MNANLSQHRFWHCHENGLNKTIQTIPHNLYVSVKLTSLYFGLRLILVTLSLGYKGHREALECRARTNLARTHF